jgi:hypothetical protein
VSGDYVSIASSLERDSLERLKAYLVLHGLDCVIKADPQGGAKASLSVAKNELERAHKVLDSVVLAGDLDSAGDDIEVAFSGEESNEIATWLQLLLEEHDQDGTPIFFYRERYEEALDQLRLEGRLVMPVYLVRGLNPFLPPVEQRMMMVRALQEFFHIVDAVASEGD